MTYVNTIGHALVELDAGEVERDGVVARVERVVGVLRDIRYSEGELACLVWLT